MKCYIVQIEKHGEASKAGDEPACNCSPSCKGSAQVCSYQPDSGDRPGKNETRDEAAQSEREESEAEDEGADVVRGGEVEPVLHRVHLFLLFERREVHLQILKC